MGQLDAWTIERVWKSPLNRTIDMQHYGVTRMGSAAKSIRYTVAKPQGPQRVLFNFDSHAITCNNIKQTIAEGPLGISPRIRSLNIL